MFLLIWLDIHEFWPKFDNIYSFLQGFRIWGQKMLNFKARRWKLRKTNVKRNFSIFIFLWIWFVYLNVGLIAFTAFQGGDCIFKHSLPTIHTERCHGRQDWHGTDALFRGGCFRGNIMKSNENNEQPWNIVKKQFGKYLPGIRKTSTNKKKQKQILSNDHHET